ncbi:MAG: glycosyl transferase family 2 [Chloroflexi bacterium]|nr:glycosyl transferase family 2 [Chloroflexota bacterium]
MSAGPRHRGAPIRSISAVLPAYNEAGNLAQVVEATLDALHDVVPSYELIIVDDGSTDGTRRIAEDLSATHTAVKVVHNAKNQGYGSAWRSGIAEASKQYTFFMDTDRQFNPTELDRLVQWDDRYDIVAGYRIRRNDPFARRVLGVCFTLLIRLMFGLKLKDIDCGFKLMRTSLLKSMDLEARGALINTEIQYRAKQRGASIREVGIHHFPRRSGEQSGASFRVILRAMREIFALRRRFTKEHRLAKAKARAEVEAHHDLPAVNAVQDGPVESPPQEPPPATG